MLFAAALTAACAASHAQVAGTQSRTISVRGEGRTYLLHAAKATRSAAPVVLSFHGLGSTAAQEELLTGFSAMAEREGFVAVYPEGERRLWHAFGQSSVDVDFARAILDELARSLPIDRRRVFATGISNGAQMAWRLACNMPREIAAVGLVAGGYPHVCGEDRPPAILFHGTADRLLPYGGRAGQMKVRDFAAGWAAVPGCRTDPARGDVVYRNGDATGERWRCGRHEAVLYTLDGKGHSWPGSRMPARITSRDVDASAVMGRFFRETGQAP
ncbi:MAG TPA: PHB depolymerase family esterase [Stellaceae bacterium]|nr:PHB depolymerase family esterase [Stellaceae bacterium]